jgi:hypothetical protein
VGIGISQSVIANYKNSDANKLTFRTTQLITKENIHTCSKILAVKSDNVERFLGIATGLTPL